MIFLFVPNSLDSGGEAMLAAESSGSEAWKHRLLHLPITSNHLPITSNHLPITSNHLSITQKRGQDLPDDIHRDFADHLPNLLDLLMVWGLEVWGLGVGV